MSTQHNKRTGKLAIRAMKRRAFLGPSDSNRLTRRTPIAVLNSIWDGNAVVLTFDQPVVFKGIPAWYDANGLFASGGLIVSPGVVRLVFPSAPQSPLTVPFEDPAIRNSVGGYVVPGLLTNPLRLGLEAFWPLQESGGNRIDVVGGHTLDEVGVIGSAAGPLGLQAAAFPGTAGDFLLTGDTAGFPLGNLPWSVACWCYAQHVAYNPCLWDFGGGNVSVIAAALFINGDPLVAPVVETAADPRSVDRSFTGFDAGSSLEGVWFHLVTVCVPPLLVKVYFNGVLRESDVAFTPNILNTDRLFLGGVAQAAWTVSQDPVIGRLCRLAVWSRSLNDQQVSNLFAAGGSPGG